MAPTRSTTLAHNILFPRVNNGDEYGDRSQDDTKQQGDAGNTSMSHNISKGEVIAIVLAVLTFLICVALVTLWMRRKAGPVAALRKTTRKNGDENMTGKDAERSDEVQRRDEEGGSIDGPPSYQEDALRG